MKKMINAQTSFKNWNSYRQENILTVLVITPFAVHYEKIRNHLLETAINCANRNSLARKYKHLRINQIQ